MTSQPPISEDLLRSAFALAERRLIEDENSRITRRITNEVKRVQYEGSLNSILVSALSDTLPRCSVRREYNKIDICAITDDGVVMTIETKGTVANSHAGDRNRISIDVHGVRTKLYPDTRDKNSVQKDIADISGKIPAGMECPRFEIFIPVIYELYREGGSQADWFSERKPWVTLSGFKKLRENMKDDLTEWFYREDPRFTLIHAAESIELRRANELWRRQSRRRFPTFRSLEAYVSFYVFARFREHV